MPCSPKEALAHLLLEQATKAPNRMVGVLANARLLASGSAEACAIACELEADAPSSRGPLMSRIATWSDLAIRSGYAKPFHLEPGVIYAVIGVLKAAGYRSAIKYLDAAKRVHVEQGRPWTSQLQQAYIAKRREAQSAISELASRLSLTSFRSATFGESQH